MNNNFDSAKPRLSHAAFSRWTAAATILASVLAFLGYLAMRHDRLVARVISTVRPGMGRPELLDVLKPLKADAPILSKNGSNKSYVFRGLDEFVVVVMDGAKDDATVAAVNHIPDGGPVWERARRNWESRLR